MTLPSDRTNLQAASSNQVPNHLLASALNIGALTTAYNTIDELYNYTNGLINAGTLSRLGIINVMNYNASGLATTAVGNITTGTKVLTLTTTPDFVQGQGINLQGAFEVASLQVTAAATVSSNITVTLNGVAFLVAVLNGDTAIQVATKIRAATFTGWTAGGTAGTDTVTFTSATSGVKTDATYSAGTTTAAGTMTTTTQGTADQISTVSSVSGLVVNIADNSTRSIAAGIVKHSDSAAVQAALNGAANSGTVICPNGTYNLNSPIAIPYGINFLGQSTSKTIFIKDHGGDGFVQVGDTSYNEITIGNFQIQPSTAYNLTGIGLSLKDVPRLRIENYRAIQCATGLKNDFCLVSEFINIALDRCTTGIYQTNAANANVFIGIKIAGNGAGTVGFQQNDGFTTKIIGGHIEYCDYPIYISGTSNVVNGFHVDNIYFESNTHGCKLAGGGNITFDNCFTSSVPLIDSSTFGATNVRVDSMTDLYPTGIGNVNVGGFYSGISFGHRTDRFFVENDMLLVDKIFSNQIILGMFSGSLYDFTGPGVRSFINTQDMTNNPQWTGYAGATKNVGAGLGGLDSFTIAAGAQLGHSYSTGSPLANRTLTQQILVKGPGEFQLVFSDNVTGQQSTKFLISTSNWTLIHITKSWGSGSTNATPALFFNNTGTGTIIVMLPMLVEKPYPIAPISRSQVNDLSTYESVRYRRLGQTVEVYGTAAPAVGTWAVGDAVINTSPAASGYMGWVCTAAGLPGTWKGYGAIQA